MLRSEPLTDGQALCEERQATRLVARAAMALVAARQEGDPARIQACEQTLHQAVMSLQARRKSAPASPQARDR